jgi:hypothetical protein
MQIYIYILFLRVHVHTLEWSIYIYFEMEYLYIYFSIYAYFSMLEYICAYTHRMESGLPSPDLLHRPVRSRIDVISMSAYM